VKAKKVKKRRLSENGHSWSPGEDSLPFELLESESVLAGLADVFFSAGLFNDRAAGKTSEKAAPDVADTYRILVEQIPAVVFIAFFDKDFREAYVSPQIEETLGFTQEEWLNDPVRWYRHVHPEDKERWSVEVAQMFLTGEPLHSTYRVLSREGRVIWFQCEVKMVRRADGQPWFIHGVGFDITDLKRAEKELTTKEEMLRGIYEYAPDTMVVINRDGLIERVNVQVERVFGYKPAELAGKPVETLIPHRFHRQHEKHRGKYTDNPHRRPMGAGFTLFGRRKDKSEFPVEIMLSPVKIEKDELVIAVIRDITKRKKNEEALQEYAERMKVLSRRLIEVQEAERRSIALELHDQIGQILTGLKLKLEMLARLPQDETKNRLDEAQTLVNEIITRTRELSLDLRPATLDHLGLLSSLLRHFRAYTSQTQVGVAFEHTGIEGKRFEPEMETAAFRIVQEALTNIARHSGAEEASVHIWSNDRTLAIEIADRGKGFDAETVLADTHSIGLQGMRERAELLGGTFKIRSDESGTCLTVEWGLEKIAD
jgi:PAS domain S-box-containing protein